MLLIIIEFVLIAGICYYLNNYLRRNYVDKFTDKSVFITGTDSGFGRHVALELDRLGLTVYAGCYTVNGGESLKKQASSKMRIVNLDVTDTNSIMKARQYIENNLPSGQGLWALVNNAGIVSGIIFEWSTIEDYENTMDVNFYGIIRVTNVFLPLVKKAHGRIVNVVGIGGRFETIPGPYACSKFAAEAYCNALRRHVNSFGIKVSIIEPGNYSTVMTSKSHLVTEFQRQWKNLSEIVKKDNGYTEEYRKKIEVQIGNIAGGDAPLATGNTLNQVADCIVHAVGSIHPKTRYVCGFDAHLIYRPAATFIPDWLLDFVTAIVYRH